MPMKTILVQINDLIDKHGDSFTDCKGCSICKEIHLLQKKSERDPAEKFAHILKKGQEMTRNEIEMLLENEVSKKVIKKALGMNSLDFYNLMKNYGFSKERGAGEVAKLKMTVEEFVQMKFVEGWTYTKIAELKGVADASIYYWKDKNKEAIEAAVKAIGLPAEKEGRLIKVSQKESKLDEYSRLVNELSNALEAERKIGKEKDTLVEKLQNRINELESTSVNIDAACDDIETELASVKETSEKYLEQLLETRDRLVRKDYELENNKKAVESVNQVLRKTMKQNEVLKELVKAGAMAQLEFL